MRRFQRTLLVAVVAMLLIGLSWTGSAQALLLITDPGAGNPRNDHTGTVGMVFRTGPQDLVVDALGFWDQDSDGLTDSHDVGIFNDGAGGALVASATIQAGTASTLVGEFRYESIAPVTLAANSYYTIGAQYPGGSSDRFRDQNGGTVFDLTGLDPAPASRAARWVTSGVLTYPNNQASNDTSYVGPNMQYTPGAVAPPPPPMLAHWSFDSAATPLTDESGNYTATAGGDAARTTATTASGTGALALDGSGDLITLPNLSAPFTDSATLSMWVKLANHTPTDPSRTGFGAFGANTDNSHYTWTDGAGYFATFRDGSRVNGVQLNAAPDRTEWAHLAITTEPGSATYHVYQNGQPVAQADPGTFVMPLAPTLGKSFGDFFVDGFVDEVALRNTTRSVAQIRAEYVAGVAGVEGVRVLDLADIVGGGNGLGTGADQGINPTNGNLETAHFYGDTITPNGTFALVPALPLVDSVFVPGDAASQPTQLNSAGDAVTLPATNGWSWDHIWNGPNVGVYDNWANGVNYDTAAHSEIGFHRNKGITFDLDAIRDANRGYNIDRFMSVGGDDRGTSNFRIYLDDDLVFDQSIAAWSGAFMEVPIDGSDRFLTLVAINGGWSFFGDPQLLMTVPEPGSMTLALLGLLTLLGYWIKKQYTPSRLRT